MIFNETELPGAFLMEPERLEDERGFFARTYDRSIFQEYGLVAEIAQSSISFNGRKGTLRGLHYQASPFGEGKLVRCTRGAIHNVIVRLSGQRRQFFYSQRAVVGGDGSWKPTIQCLVTSVGSWRLTAGDPS
jgi:dTDP-4-dehydrorhamnose 3,5-epimerase